MASFVSMLPRPSCILFPYTTLFRSGPNFTLEVPLSNEGRVEVQNGSLTIAGGSSSSGSYIADAGARERSHRPQNFTARTVWDGGTCSLNETATVASSYTINYCTAIP